MQDATKFVGVSGGRGANAPVNTTDLLDSRSVVRFTISFSIRQTLHSSNAE
jgi:hypothetical protein